MAVGQAKVRVQRWQGGQHPSVSAINRMLRKEELRPYMWENAANHRYAVRTHGYHKVLYVINGTLDITLPDSNEQVRLKGGDRIDIPAGTRHGTIIGSGGAKCVEAAVTSRRSVR